MSEIQIGLQLVGDGHPCYLVGEIGINHNGDIDLAKKLIATAKNAGWNAVKFQKRSVEIVYTAEELAMPRENPFGPTNGDLKRGLEFGLELLNARAVKVCGSHTALPRVTCAAIYFSRPISL